MERLAGRRPLGVWDVIWVAQIVVVLGLIGYIAQNILADGSLFAREYFAILPGIHWFYIMIFVVVFLAYMLEDRAANLLYIVPIGIAYFCVHEVLFNAFFLPYNGFGNPAGVSPSWYLEIYGVFIITAIFIPIALKFKGRFMRTSRGRRWKYLAAGLWASMIVLYIVRIAYGFPVTINVYDLAALSQTFNNPLANDFELATNLLFAPVFFFTFTFTFRRMKGGRSNRREAADQTVQRSGTGEPQAPPLVSATADLGPAHVHGEAGREPLSLHSGPDGERGVAGDPAPVGGFALSHVAEVLEPSL